jgi:hypothetical protein
MKKIIFGMMIFSLNAYSATIDLKITSQVKNNNSAKVASSSIVATIGKEFGLPFQNSNNLSLKMKITELKMHPESNAPSELNFDVKILEQKAGKVTVLSSPQVITVIGKEAKVTMKDSNGQSIELTLLPSKITQ